MLKFYGLAQEIYNIFDAINCGCDIITIPEQIYQKIPLIGKDLNNYSKKLYNSL